MNKQRVNVFNIIVIDLFQLHHWDAQNGIVALLDEDDESPTNNEGA